MVRTMLITGFALLLHSTVLQAHDLPVSELKLVADDDRLHLEIMLNAWELQFFNELDGDRNGLLDRQELQGREEEVARAVVDALDIRVDGELVKAEVAGIVPDYNTHHVTVRAHYSVDCREAAVEVSSRLAAVTSSAHVVKLALNRNGATERATLSSSDSVARFPVSREAVPKESGERPPGESWLESRTGVALVLAVAIGSLLFLAKRKVAKAQP